MCNAFLSFEANSFLALPAFTPQTATSGEHRQGRGFAVGTVVPKVVTMETLMGGAFHGRTGFPRESKSKELGQFSEWMKEEPASAKLCGMPEFSVISEHLRNTESFLAFHT